MGRNSKSPIANPLVMDSIAEDFSVSLHDIITFYLRTPDKAPAQTKVLPQRVPFIDTSIVSRYSVDELIGCCKGNILLPG